MDRMTSNRLLALAIPPDPPTPRRRLVRALPLLAFPPETVAAVPPVMTPVEAPREATAAPLVEAAVALPVAAVAEAVPQAAAAAVMIPVVTATVPLPVIAAATVVGPGTPTMTVILTHRPQILPMPPAAHGVENVTRSRISR